ncbi:MAG: aminotransferase class I/II-fold pyridoxal phosphate-dependent enzyme [Ignavibacteriales bacterium]|nr:aminotransferase class I/II-fold pyridoxal phosphate-dependent enzyme [Ignavibacteriales bacterium]
MKKNSTHKNGKDGHRYAQETRLIWGRSYTPKWDYAHHVIPPVSSSSTFRLDSTKRGAQGFVEFAHHAEDFRVQTRSPVYIYDRLGEPNKDMLEENLAIAERSECAVTFSSGMGAVSALCGILLGSGSEIVAHRTLYGCTYSLFKNWMPRNRIKVTWVDFTDLKALDQAISPQTRLLYFESPVNPTLELIDMASVVEIARNHNRNRKPDNRIHTAVDNTFATPFCQRPIEFGIDFVIESLTKGICGFGTDVGGVVAGPEWSYNQLLLYRKDFGGILSPKSAWPILVYGLPSLAVRFRQQMQNAIAVAEALERDNRVRSVSYPGLDTFRQRSLAHKQMRDYDGRFAPGTIVYFTVSGETAAERHRNAETVVDYIAEHSYSMTLAVSLGIIRTLIEHPGSMTHSSIPLEEQVKRGMDPGGIRLSVGLENPDDIIHDLRQALDHVRKSRPKHGNGVDRKSRKTRPVRRPVLS